MGERRNWLERPDPYSLVQLLEDCAVNNGEARANAARLARYAAECLGPLLDAADRAKGTLISAEFHIQRGSWDEMRAHAIQSLDAALGSQAPRSVQ